MHNLWRRISLLGVNTSGRSIEVRSKIISNRINFFSLLIMAVLLLINMAVSNTRDRPFDYSSWRISLLLAINLINLYLAYKGIFKLLKLLLIFIPAFIFIVFSSIIGFVEEESFFYYPYVAIAFSLVPQLVLDFDKEQKLYIVSLIYYLVIILISDNLLSHFASPNLVSPDLIRNFYIYYKIVPILIFFFLVASIYDIRKLNFEFEEDLVSYNEELGATIEELHQTQAHLVQREKMASLGTLTAGVAHEINNPLNHINGGLYIFEELKEKVGCCLPKEEKEEFDHALGMLKSGMNATSSIVNSLMQFSYRGEPKMVRANINDIVDNTLLFLKSGVDKSITVEKNFQLDCLIDIYADKIHQVVLNLLENAIYAVRSSKDEKRISLKTFKNGSHICLDVFNTGNTIKESHLNRIFDPFFTTKAPGEGSGLGLSVCYTVLEEHNGTISAINESNGVRFRISLPLN